MAAVEYLTLSGGVISSEVCNSYEVYQIFTWTSDGRIVRDVRSPFEDVGRLRKRRVSNVDCRSVNVQITGWYGAGGNR